MEELEQLQKNVDSKRKQIIGELKQLRENPIVKRFLKLNQKNNMLLEQRKDLIKKIKIQEYTSCHHLLVTTKIERDYIEGRTERCYGCIKCGLNEDVLNRVSGTFGTDFLTFEEKIMYEYLKYGNFGYTINNLIPVACDIDLAKALYSKIKENNPNIDDETAKKFFEIALDNIRKTKMSDEEKQNTAKILSLNPKFNKWTAWDVEK